ncbi:phosphate/phosphite/phosphonate ABC transporter substrate-binding protein [Sulfitobacter sp. JL08]|jgi:phosphonate transport system substrate-binding protein|uniref:phosphate/phosphite/phosphonate ABC transporter substrate-binding protein n=1 Tax=Sulfitobacter sp. JL08 TaxID=2070369 RepID=UPI000E0BAEB7|nr:phosphate/phosphite/phosphonate ABC transporter substrate-binding protein [Sulfitobacter sp. JL08]AXI55056.1 phosphate/phosphite/phosphonate ABC transporter substrate-binding protein [Sulfitobacter sp. JL08]
MKNWTKATKTVAATLLASVVSTGALVAQECKNPEVIRFSMIPTEETTQELSLYQPLVNRIKEATGKNVEFFLPTSYASVVEAMLGGFVDLGMHGPYSYVIAQEKDPELRVIATYAKHKGQFQEEGPGYKAVLVARADSGFTTVEDLKGTVIGLTDPASTSGNLLPRVSFTKVIGAELEDYFSRVVYTGGHDLSGVAVIEGQVDAAFVATHRLDNVLDRGIASMDDYVVIWSSPVIPQDPFVVNGRLCPEIIEQIQTAFLTLNDSEEGRQYLENVNASKFVAMTDADYDIIRDLKAAKDAKNN